MLNLKNMIMILSNCKLYRLYKRAPKALDAMTGVYLPL